MDRVHQQPSFSKGQGTVWKSEWNDFLNLLPQITVLISLTLIFWLLTMQILSSLSTMYFLKFKCNSAACVLLGNPPASQGYESACPGSADISLLVVKVWDLQILSGNSFPPAVSGSPPMSGSCGQVEVASPPCFFPTPEASVSLVNLLMVIA